MVHYGRRRGRPLWVSRAADVCTLLAPITHVPNLAGTRSLPLRVPHGFPPTTLRPTCHPRSTAHDATSHYAAYTHSQGPAQREEQLDGRHQRGTADRDVPAVLSTSRRRRRDTPPHGQPPRRQRDGRQGRGQAAIYPADAGAWSRREYCKGEESSP